MLSVKCPRVHLQKHDFEINDMVKLVKLQLPECDNLVRKEKKLQDEIDRRAYNEILELAQRKLLRQVISLANKVNVSYLPHLPVLDLKFDKNTKSKNYEFTFLCEYEEGWHIPTNKISKTWDVSTSSSDESDNLKIWSPYLARIFAVLKFSTISLSIFAQNEGQDIVNQLIEKSVRVEDIGDSSFEAAYANIMENLNELTDIFINGECSLAKCHTGSGKILWLCEDHQKYPRITKLEIEESGEDQPKVVQGFDPNQVFADQFKSNDNEQAIKLRGKFIGAQVAASTTVKLDKLREMNEKEQNFESEESKDETADTERERSDVTGKLIASQKQTSRACIIS